MFDSDQFIAATQAVHDLVFRLARRVEWNFTSLHLTVRMSKRGVDRFFLERVRDSAAEAQMSAHARLAFETDLEKLPSALRALRRAHRTAAGGLPARIWQQGDLAFSLSSGGTFKLMYGRADFRHESQTGPQAFLVLDSRHPAEDLANRLARHARLDLKETKARYKISSDAKNEVAYFVHAPDGARAMARLLVLTDTPAEKWTHLHEVQDAECAKTAALALLDTP